MEWFAINESKNPVSYWQGEDGQNLLTTIHNFKTKPKGTDSVHFTYIYIYIYIYIYVSPKAQQPLVGQSLIIVEASRNHTQTHHTWQDSTGRAISPSQRPLPKNTQHSQGADIQWHSNKQTQQASSHRPTPQTTWPLYIYTNIIMYLVLCRFLYDTFTMKSFKNAQITLLRLSICLSVH